MPIGVTVGRAMNHHTGDTTSWTSDELSPIEAAQEREIAPLRRDGTLRKAVPIWVVRAGDDLYVRADEDLYVRAAYGPGTGWHRVARASHTAASGPPMSRLASTPGRKPWSAALAS